MDRFEIVKTRGGYEIRAMDGKRPHPVYLGLVCSGKYEWVTDYMYGKRFSKRTAEKHLEILRRNGK